MAKVAEKKKAVSRFTVEEKVTGFNAAEMHAPAVLRLGAALIDYIILLLFPVSSIIIGRFMGYDGSKLLNSEIANIGVLLMILFGVSNLIIFPSFNGQSVGKMFTGIRITKMDGSSVTFKTILVRHLIGYFFTLLSCGLGFIVAIFTPDGRALHDYIAGTVVVYGRSTIKQEIVTTKKPKVAGIRTAKGT
ncbi:MAG: RDD family protein [Pyrinomonadaceae bacterium]